MIVLFRVATSQQKEKDMSEENVKEIEGQELDAGVEPTAEDIAEAEAAIREEEE